MVRWRTSHDPLCVFLARQRDLALSQPRFLSCDTTRLACLHEALAASYQYVLHVCQWRERGLAGEDRGIMPCAVVDEEA